MMKADAVRVSERVEMDVHTNNGKLRSTMEMTNDQLPAYLDKIVDASMSRHSKFSLRQLYRLLVAAYKGERIDITS
ncbi:MAG: hypothetical protein AABO41_00390 [Acidobacteriota bacterium]